MFSSIAAWLTCALATAPPLGADPPPPSTAQTPIALEQASPLPDAAAAQETAGQVPPLETPDAGAQAPATRAPSKADPWEPANRLTFRLSDALDGVLLRPAAMAYKAVIPEAVRGGVRRAALNLSEPRTAANDLLQGRLGAAGSSVLRFLTNSTLGLLGVFDVAEGMGLKRHDNDFGLTMARLNIGPGPYLYVPVLGPTSLRDLGGEAVDFAFDPFTWMAGKTEAIDLGLRATEALDRRIDIDPDLQGLRQTSADLYATIRSVHLQQREGEVKEGQIDLQDLPEFPDDSPPEPQAASPPFPSPSASEWRSASPGERAQ